MVHPYVVELPPNRPLEICGIGQGVIDILAPVSRSFLDARQLERGSYRMVTAAEQRALLAALPDGPRTVTSGGSLANSIATLGQLGAGAEFVCRLGADSIGAEFQRAMERCGAGVREPAERCGETGCCLSLITPDGERTMRTYLGDAHLEAADLSPESVRDAAVVVIEGYLLGSPERGVPLVARAAALAREGGALVVLTLSNPGIAEHSRDFLRALAPSVSVIIADELEAQAFSGVVGAENALKSLTALVPVAVVTRGESGSLIGTPHGTASVPTFPCRPIDLTGAGDMFVAGLIYGMLRGVEIHAAARAASYLAMKVILQVGARFEAGVPELWREALRS